MNPPEFSVRLRRIAAAELLEIVTYIAMDRARAAKTSANRTETELWDVF